MQLYIPGGPQRDYTEVDAPHTFEAPKHYADLPTPTLVIRKRGEAWEDPFVVVYEPFNETEQGPSIRSVEKLVQAGKYKGLAIRSETPSQTLTQYVITRSEDERFTDRKLGIDFTGAFAVVTLSESGALRSLYIGEGERLSYGKTKLDAGTDRKAFKAYD